MTTIASDGIRMAADRQMTIDSGRITRHQRYGKINRLPDGSILALAGDAAHCAAIRKYFVGGEQGDTPTVDDYCGLILTSEGLFMIGGSTDRIAIQAPHAFGTGSEFAIGAMAAGATLERAMEIAGEHDAFTGSEIDILAIDDQSNAPAN